MKIVVIGASAAGLKAGCRARRINPEAKVTVVEKGKYISYAACGLPYFVSGDVDSFVQLQKTAYDVVKDAEYFANTKDITVMTETAAIKIDTSGKTVQCEKSSGEKLELPFDKLIIATGAEPAIPNIEGVDLPGVTTFTKAEEAMALRKDLQAGKIGKVCIAGGGFIGCELTESFIAMWGAETELLEAKPYILSQMLDEEMARIVTKEICRNGAEVHTGSAVQKIVEDGGKLKVVTSKWTAGGFDRVIIAAGVKPSVKLAQDAGIETGETGGIKVDFRLMTKMEDIFAAGDCAEFQRAVDKEPAYIPLGSLANRMGRTAGNSAAGKLDFMTGITGASCLKVFDLTVAAVGMTAEAACHAGYNSGESWGVFTDRAHYSPDSQLFSAKIVYDRDEHRLLGVQAAGRGNILRHIDAASVMIKYGATLGEICDYEPAYAPPFANALDPLHYLAYAAIADGAEGVKVLNPLKAEEFAEGAVVLDVREESEIAEAQLDLPGKSNLAIPLTQLRKRTGEIPPGEKILVVCQRGTRSAEAVRILKEKGWKDVCYLGGGAGFNL